MRTHDKIFGRVPYGTEHLNLTRALPCTGDESLALPIFFGLGWSVNPRSTPRHSLQALLLTHHDLKRGL